MNYYKDYRKFQFNIIDSLKSIVYKRHNDIFQRIDFDDDSIYLEPLLHSYIHQPDNKWLDSIIYGYEQIKPTHINVFTNCRGVVYLPNVGYLKTLSPNQCLRLTTQQDTLKLDLDENEINYQFEDLLYCDNGVEIMRDLHPLMENIMVDLGANLMDVEVDKIYLQYILSLNKGFDVIKKGNPNHFELLLKSIKKICLFRSSKPNSFALMAAHNMIFLNVSSCDNEIFFADHISHEGAHVIFFTLTYKSKYKFFTCDFNTPLGNFIGEPGRYGSVYLFFHGLFTFVEITKCLAKCIQDNQFSGLQLHDIQGRFIFHMQRFKLTIARFEELNILKDEAKLWFELFKKQHSELNDLYEKLFPLYSLIKQPYDFNSRVFAEVNSLN